MGFVARACLSIRAGSMPGSGGPSCRTASQLADAALRNAQQHCRIADRKLRGEAPEELRGLAGDLSGGALLLAAAGAQPACRIVVARRRTTRRQRATGVTDGQQTAGGAGEPRPVRIEDRVRSGAGGQGDAGLARISRVRPAGRDGSSRTRYGSGSPSRRGRERPGRLSGRADRGGLRPGSPSAAGRSADPRPALPGGGAGAGRTGRRTPRGPAGRRDHREGGQAQ